MSETRKEPSVTGLEIATGYVRDMVAMFRRRGVKTEYAITDVATVLELSPKRTRSIFYRDSIWRLACDEVARIEARFAAHLDREIALSVEYTEALRAKRNELSGRETACEASQQATSGSGSIGSRCGLAA